MEIQDADGRKYDLRFAYAWVEDDDGVGGGLRRAVQATLAPKGGAYPHFDQRTRSPLHGRVTGLALCSESDNFQKEVGRALALRRALEVVALLTSPENAEALRRAYDARPRGVAPVPGGAA